jgi:electron transfer flavoprotein beta subunit
VNIVVCVKHIPDPNLPPELDGNRLKREGVQGVLDPGDKYGVEAALKLKEAHGGEVTLVCMGPVAAKEAITGGLAMGADKGILISDDQLQNSDALVTAKVLAAAIKRNEFDLVVSGVESTDGYTGTMASTLAEFLDLPQVTFVKKIEGSNGTIKVDRQTADGYHVIESATPALITVTASAEFEPRYASFKGIMAAKKKPVEELSLSDLGLAGDEVAIKQQVAETTPAEERKAGEVFTDDGTGAAKIADFLKEAKVI